MNGETFSVDALTLFQSETMLGRDRTKLPPYCGDADSDDPRSMAYYEAAEPVAEAEQALSTLRVYFRKRHERDVKAESA